jgi:uncharacterized BrkB/YihY/UPF0761 family membrane protein
MSRENQTQDDERISLVPTQRESGASKNVFSLLKQTFNEWLQDKAPQLGAALAYYTVFSLAPLILVLLAIVGVIFRDDPAGAWDKITQQMSYFLDPSAIQVVQNIAEKLRSLAKAPSPQSSASRSRFSAQAACSASFRTP